MKAPLLCLPALLLPGLAPAAEADFTRDVKPVLAKHCVGCHGPEKRRASLRLDTARAIRAGGTSGPAVVPGKSGDSLVMKAVMGLDDAKPMPPKGPRLSKGEVAVLKKWIDEGAKAPPGEVVEDGPRRSTHWAFQPVVRPALPAVKDAGWPRNAIDHFILARLEKHGVRPSPEADAVTLLRRVSLDLTGIPPAPGEVKAFVEDRRPGAYERAVERLLASPQYGERWGRHWLDQARYADSNGYSIDAPRTIWKYRDWVISALNADMPFDRFTVEQLAGDLLPNATPEQKVATGFHRNTQINQEGGIDVEQFRVEAVVDRANTTGAVWLGLTVGCAQCHDHKFDPISQKEYYQLYAFFNNSDDPNLTLLTEEMQRRRKQTADQIAALEKALLAIDRLTEETQEKWEGSLSPEARKLLPKRIQDILVAPPNGRTPRQLAALRDAYRDLDKVRHVVGGVAGPWALAGQAHLLSRRVDLEKRVARLKKVLPAQLTTMVLNERKTPRMSYVQVGGDFLRKGATVSPGTPGVLPQLPKKERPTRLDLARWLVNGESPLTGRVLANRTWQRYFGLGLVETENDFGTQGTAPSHPELLDWLADEVVRRGWSLKGLHRLIVTSATYRQASNARPDLRVLDPRNVLLARQNRLRLEAEVVRDVALFASGLLVPAVGGPGNYPPQPQGVYSFTQVKRNWVVSTGPDRYRRGLYTFFYRSAPHPGLTVFDAPDATVACTRRNRSNTPLQALTLLNDEAFVECARALAGRAQSGGDEGDEARLRRAFRLALAREPSSREEAVLGALLRRQREALSQDGSEARALAGPQALKGADLAERAAWVQVCRVLLNLDEFITRE